MNPQFVKLLLVVVCAIGIFATGDIEAQTGESGSAEIKRTWRVGAHITGPNKVAATNLTVTFPIPTDWPEQHVSVYQENIPNEARNADYRDSDGVRQLVAKIPRVNATETLEINVIIDITVRAVPFPDRTDHWVVPERSPRDVRFHLNPSPLIERRARVVKNKVKELIEGHDSAWAQVEAFYQFVISELDVAQQKIVGAEETLKTMKGAPEDMANVFVALCRAHKVPARIVWANGGEYAEFYLQDDQGRGRWFPAVVEGSTEFGQMSNPRVIIQKGDNIKVPEKSQRQRLIVEYVKGKARGNARPRVRFLRDELPARDRTGSGN